MIGKGDSERKKLFEGLGIEKYFKYVKLVSEKEESQFSYCLDKLGYSVKDTWSIGDRVKKEIRISKRLGIKTIWIKSGKFASEMPSCEEEPDYIVNSFEGVEKIIKL